MPNLYDLAYAIGLGASAPYWLIKPAARRKVFAALRQRMARDLPHRAAGPAILIHAVSVGEVNSTPALVQALRDRRPGIQFIISTTTQTGFERSKQLYAGDGGITFIRYPLDFTAAVTRVLDRLKPSAVVLMELEAWPNFLCQCEKRHIPVLVAAGRVTEPAFRRYRLGGPIMRAMFNRLSAVAVQDEVYAARFAALGVPPDRLHILGTMKFDSATIADRIEGDTLLAQEVGLRPGAEPIWVCGSTGPGEEQIILAAYRTLLKDHPTLRLAIIPRHPPRFDEVATLITRYGYCLTRRSAAQSTLQNPQSTIVLGDTMGELRKFYSLATVVFVGRSMVDLGPRQHGSDMIEPAALAKATIVGPFTGNFDMPVRLLKAANAIVEMTAPHALAAEVDRFLVDASRRAEFGGRAQEVVRAAKGSTGCHAEMILKFLPATSR